MMTNREKAELCDLARRCATCSARNGMPKFNCQDANCNDEYDKNLDWLMEDYNSTPKGWVNEAPIEVNEPPVDWSKVPVDTLIEVSDDGEHWHKKYFAKRENTFWVWIGGATSKTAMGDTECWYYARLVEE